MKKHKTHPAFRVLNSFDFQTDFNLPILPQNLKEIQAMVPVTSFDGQKKDGMTDQLVTTLTGQSLQSGKDVMVKTKHKVHNYNIYIIVGYHASEHQFPGISYRQMYVGISGIDRCMYTYERSPSL